MNEQVALSYPRVWQGVPHLEHITIMLFGDGEATLKKIEYRLGEDWIDLVPINPEYATKRISGADLDQCRVVGRVVRVFRSVDEI